MKNKPTLCKQGFFLLFKTKELLRNKLNNLDKYKCSSYFLTVPKKRGSIGVDMLKIDVDGDTSELVREFGWQV